MSRAKRRTLGAAVAAGLLTSGGCWAPVALAAVPGNAATGGPAPTWALDPDVLLMDEPFAALDVNTRMSVQREFLELWQREEHRTVIFVTHDLGEAVALADRIVLMGEGKILDDVQVDIHGHENSRRCPPTRNTRRYTNACVHGCTESSSAIKHPDKQETPTDARQTLRNHNRRDIGPAHLVGRVRLRRHAPHVGKRPHVHHDRQYGEQLPEFSLHDRPGAGASSTAPASRSKRSPPPRGRS